MLVSLSPYLAFSEYSGNSLSRYLCPGAQKGLSNLPNILSTFILIHLSCDFLGPRAKKLPSHIGCWMSQIGVGYM